MRTERNSFVLYGIITGHIQLLSTYPPLNELSRYSGSSSICGAFERSIFGNKLVPEKAASPIPNGGQCSKIVQ